MASGVNLSFYQGDTYTTILTVNDNDGNAVNLTNYSGYAPAFYRYGYTEPDFQFYINVYQPMSGLIKLTAYGASTTGVPAGRLHYQTRLYSTVNSSFVSHYGDIDLLPGDISLGGWDGGSGVPAGNYTYNQRIDVTTGIYYQFIEFPEPFSSVPCVLTQLQLPNVEGTSWYFVGTSGITETGMYLTYGEQVLETGYKVVVLAQNCSSF